MKNKLISLLLEIYEKEIYKEKGCRDIYEYAFKYAKLSTEVVEKAIRTLKHLENKPCLKKIIETQGIHKVALVATIATTENEQIFAKHVQNMSKAALFEFAKELRSGQEKMKCDVGNNMQLFNECCEENLKINENFCQAVPSKIQIELDAEMQIMFLGFKEKYAKNMSNKEALKMMMKKIEEGEKESMTEDKIRKEQKNGSEKKESSDGQSKRGAKVNCGESGQQKSSVPSRHIPKIKKEKILKKYQHKCAYPGCVKAVETMHHRVPFAFERSHKSIIPLCKIHHEFAHNGVIAHELKEPENWRLKIAGEKSIFDGLYVANRMSE